ncbi:hypothetical protein [Sphingomonas sp. PB1R3]|uniref:hypothetical protein n=1 Tax=Sphingomonas flavida TaxID=3096154 RepID=UPI002FCC0210
MPQAVIGCDLSPAVIDICDLPSGRIRPIANTPGVIAAWLDTLDHDIRLVFETTGGCDGDLIARRASSPEPSVRWPRPTASMPACSRRSARR